MTIAEKKTFWKGQVGENNIKEIFPLMLSELKDDSDVFNQLLLNQFRYNKIKEQNILGILSFEEYSRSLTKINYAIIEIIDSLTERAIKTNKREDVVSKNINPKEVIEFISNRINEIVIEFITYEKSGVLSDDTVFREKAKKKQSIYDFYCNDNGEYKFILETTETMEIYHQRRDCDTWNDETRKFQFFEGKFGELTKVTLEKNTKYANSQVGDLKLIAYNAVSCIRYKETSTYKYSKKYPEIFEKEEKYNPDFKMNTHELIINVAFNEISHRIKNALEYLITHFGGKSEFF